MSNPKVSLEAMVRGKVLTLPGHIQAIFVQNMLKLFVRIIVTAEEEDDSEMIDEVGIIHIKIFANLCILKNL